MRLPGRTMRQRHSGGFDRARRAARPLICGTLLVAFGWLVLSLVGAGTALLVPVAYANHANHADNNATLSLVQPVDPEGPVGANVVARIQNASKNVNFQLAYPASGADCTSTPLTPITGLSSNTTNDNGSRTFTFVWPAASGVGIFLMCAELGDNGGTIVQSDKPYTVLTASAPSITVAPVVSATATAGGGGTTQVTPVASPTFVVGSQVTVTGTNFVPGGTQIGVWESGVQVAHNVNDLGDQLTVVSGDRHTDTNGSFSVVVTLASGRIDQTYIHVATGDGTNSLPPTLDVSQLITIGQPAPTPTITVTPTNTATGQQTPTGPKSSGGDVGLGRILAIGGLSAFSVLLLVIGTMLLISAGRRP